MMKDTAIYPFLMKQTDIFHGVQSMFGFEI